PATRRGGDELHARHGARVDAARRRPRGVAAVTSLAFVACVEQGSLEEKARLLVRSIRRFAGAHREAPIHTFAPRAGRGIGEETGVRPVEFHRWGERDDEEYRSSHHLRVSSAGDGDRGDGYWLRMYELLGVEARPFVETSCDRVRIRAYANSGLVAVRRDAG